MSYFGSQICNFWLYLLFFIYGSVYSWFEYCDHTLNLDEGKSIYIVSPYFPSKYPSGSSCRYTIQTVSDNRLEFNCTIDLYKFRNKCTTETFYFNSEGSKTINDSEYFCGNGTFIRNSMFSQASIFYTSSQTSSPISSSALNSGTLSGNNNNSGWFNCLIKSTPQLLCDCGWSVSGKIVGGHEASINEFPSMGGLTLLGNVKKIFCGATIIHHRYLLSAAHCFMRPITNDPKNIGVLVGEHDIENQMETIYTDLYYIEKIIFHEQFDMKTSKNDIVLIRTIKSIQWYIGVGPVCLPFKYHRNYFIGKRLDVAGWGTTSFGGYQSKKLHKTTLDVIDRNECKNILEKQQQQQQFYNDENQFCTYTNYKDTCQYDSGGALYYRDLTRKLYAIGIASYGYGCALKIPSINIDIISYLPWIEYNAADAKFCKI